MDKLLTISIAAYNVEKYIKETLESLISNDFIDLVEVFVVDDGGTDKTFEIASHYEKRYPNSIHVIHKENGGYGSTVNYSIQHASGKYFKLLDGDDWFDSEGLSKLIRFLGSSDTDIIITNYKSGPNNDSLRIHNYFEDEGAGVKQLAGFIPKKYFGMWPMVIKTSILREINLALPEHELYTDQFYCTYPLAAAKTIEYIDACVYCYRTDIDGQSTSKESRIKHYKETLNHAEILTEFCAKQKNNQNYPIILKRVGAYHSGAINVLLLLPKAKQNFEKIKEFDKRIKRISEDVYHESVKAGETGKVIWLMRFTFYSAYWIIKIFY